MTQSSSPESITYTEAVQCSQKLGESKPKKQKEKGSNPNKKSKKSYWQSIVEFLKTQLIPNIIRYWKSFIASIKALWGKSGQVFKKFSNRYPNFKNKRLMMLGIFLSVLLVTAIIFIFEHHSGPNPETNLSKINQVQTELTQIQTTVKNTSQMNVMERRRLAKRLIAIDHKLNVISRQNGQNKQLRQLKINMESTTAELSKKIAVLNHQIHQMKSKIFPAPTLSASVLPFKVVSIDPWNGVPYAEVVQRHNSTMVSYVGLSQRIGGWKVIDMSVPEQSVTFMNRQKQVVHIQLKSF